MAAMRPLPSALLAQFFGWLIAQALMRLVWPPLLALPFIAAGIQGLCAAFVAYKLEMPRWWQPIHMVFPPLAVAALGLGLPPWVWLAGFVALLLVFWRTDLSRVPLYLTNTTTADALAALLPATPCRVLDLGCGTGGVLMRLAALRPDCHFTGIEHAPLPWLWAWLRSRGLDNVAVRYGDFWGEHLGPYGLVYAFLSPAPMPRLWQKAATESGTDAWLISNSFAVPEQTPSQVIEVTDRRRSRLLCYRPGRRE
jgi:hypothetical protein